jgi:diguanylate cyclase (GGDEF)-like protein/PAS domain S-box-containing protein
LSETPGSADDRTPSPISHAEHEMWSAIIDEIAVDGQGMDATLQRLTEHAAVRLQATVSIFLVSGDVLEPKALWDEDPERLAGVRDVFARGPLSTDVGQLGQVLATGRPLLIQSAAEPAEATPYAGYIDSAGLHSYLLVPVIVDRVPLGVLGIGRHGDQPVIDDSLTDVAVRLAQVAGQVVRVTKLVERGRLVDVALNAMRDAVIAVDTEGRVTSWNDGAEQLYGIRSSDALNQPITGFLASTEIETHQPIDPEGIAEHVQRRGLWIGRLRQSRPDAAPVVVESRVTPLTWSGTGAGAVIVNRDISDIVAIGSELRRQELLAQAALDASPMLTAVVDELGVVLAASRRWSERLGAESGIGALLSAVIETLLPDPEARQRLHRSFNEVVSDSVPRTQGDYEVQTGAVARTFSVHISRVPDVGAALTIADVTDRASRERELSFSATHDVVTRLPNRSVLIERTSRALNRAARHGAKVGLLFCDLDGFKSLNDRHGHGAGDDILEFLGVRLVQSCRHTDTVARIGGDEFAILIEDSVGDDTVQTVAQRVVEAAKSPLRVPIGDVSLTTSIGALIVETSSDRVYSGADVDQMLRQADAAMYEAKRRGKNRWVLFDEAVQASHESRGALVGDLVRGTRSGEFLLHYQPQFDAAESLCGAEALLRWYHPTRGLIEPFDLIHQEGALPIAVGDWVLGQVAAILAQWAPGLPSEFRLGVNVSRSQWMDRNIADVMLDWLRRSGVPATRLRVELPSEAITEDVDYAVSTTRRLASAGVDIALNDFGAGGCQLMDLSRLALNSVVLTRRMVRDIGREPGAESMLRAVVAMSRQMGWRVIATGIENEEQQAAVRAVGCETAQGFLLGRPVPATEFAARYLSSASGQGPSDSGH